MRMRMVCAGGSAQEFEQKERAILESLSAQITCESDNYRAQIRARLGVLPTQAFTVVDAWMCSRDECILKSCVQPRCTRSSDEDKNLTTNTRCEEF